MVATDLFLRKTMSKHTCLTNVGSPICPGCREEGHFYIDDGGSITLVEVEE